MMHRTAIMNYLADGVSLLEAMHADAALQQRVSDLVDCLLKCLRSGGRLFWAGNGGSAGDAQHLSSELVGRFQKTRPGLRSHALTADTTLLTALSNDFGYVHIFAHQLQALASPGDVFIGLSTSGTSPNIVEAMAYAHQHDIVTVGFTGLSAGQTLFDLLDYAIVIPAHRTDLVQEGYMRIGHIVCACIESALFPALS